MNKGHNGLKNDHKSLTYQTRTKSIYVTTRKSNLDCCTLKAKEIPARKVDDANR